MIASTGGGLLGGGSILAISNLYTSWRNREHQKEENGLNREHQKEENGLNREHQARESQLTREFQQHLKNQEFAEAEKLQRLLQKERFAHDRQLQQTNFENNVNLWESHNFYNNVWPLADSPKHYVTQITKDYLDTRQPIQIIVTDSLPPDYKAVMLQLQSFFTKHYPQCGASPVIYYSQGWKDSMRHKDGTAQLMALHGVLAGLPTLVLMPFIDTATKEFHLKMSFWGMGDLSSLQHADVVTLDMAALEQDLIRQDTHSQMELFLECPELQDDNYAVYKKEQSIRIAMQQKGRPEKEITGKLRDGIAGRYKKEQAWVLKEVSEAISALIAESGATLVDFYQLLDENPMPPRLPAIIQEKWPQEAELRLIRYADAILGLLDANTFTSELHRFTLPMSQAVAAKAFSDAGDAKTATELQTRAWDALSTWYQGHDRKIPDGHRACMRYLKEACGVVPVPFRQWVTEERLSIAPQKRPAGDAETVVLPGNVPLDLVWCPPGTFWMGSPNDEVGRGDSETRHRVTLTRGFWMGKYPVTQEQWEAVMGAGTNPSHFKGAELPVEQVSWEDSQVFLEKVNALASGGGFRLPTEAEWEYACRAGTETAFCYGNRLDATMANFDGNYPYGGGGTGVYRQKTTRVGMFKPNGWGLYDMHGNVWEWCQDWYGGFSVGAEIDPTGAASGSRRVLRGGSWIHVASRCRSAYRGGDAPSSRNDNLGFRVARALP